MNKKISLGVTIMLMFMTAAVTVCITVLWAMRTFNVNLADLSKRITMYSKLANVDEIVRNYYIGDIDENKLTDALIEGYLSGTGDLHAAYYNASSFLKTSLDLEGKGVGIGVNVVQDTATGAIRVVNVYENSPAETAGVKVGDIITVIGKSVVSELGYDNALTLLRGDEGSTVTFTVKRDGTEQTFTIVRKQFDVTTVHLHMVANTAVVRIDQFDDNSDEQFNNVVQKALDEGALTFVFDLRNNPGGSVDACAHMLDRLLPKGPIVRVRHKDKPEETMYTSDANELKVPMAVLVNGGSASASELFAAALRDYNKAKLVGEKTYGKGTMQDFYKLSDGSAVKFSVAYFDPPKSSNFDGKGLEPDIKSSLSQEKLQNFYGLTDEEDDQLQAALAYLSSLAG